MQKIPSLLFGVIFSVTGMLFAGSLPDSDPDVIPIDLSPANWNFSEGMEVEAGEDGLAFLAPGTSGWAAPGGRWPISSELQLSVDGRAGVGSLIVQVEWFDRANVLVEPAEVLRLSGGTPQSQLEKMTPPAGAASFGLKFWLEGTPPSATISALKIHRKADGMTPAEITSVVDPTSAKVEAEEGMLWDEKAAVWSFRLAEGKSFGGAHLNAPVEAKAGMRILLPILVLPPKSSVSLQVLAWSENGEFLGDTKVLADANEAGDYEIVLPEDLDGVGEFPARISVKVWITAPAGKAVQIGAIRFADPAS